MDVRPLHTPESKRSLEDARLWFALGVFSLLFAGTMSMVLVIGRLPGVAHALPFDAGFFPRALIVHVNLALGVWFFAFVAGLFCLLPGARPLRLTRPALVIATAGVLLFMSAMFFRQAAPIKSNYVPVLDHWVFVSGLAVFAVGVSLNFVDARMISRGASQVLPPGAGAGLRLAGAAFVLAMATIAAAWATQAQGLSPLQYYERLFWGGGHVLQFVNVLGMCSAWLILLADSAGRPLMTGRAPVVLLGLLAAPTVLAPWLATREDSFGWFTLMMQLGIFPMVLALVGVCGWRLWRARATLRRGPELWGTITAIGMTLIGFILGAMISAQDTLIPAHYHVSIGAVTATYMAFTLAWLPRLGRTISARMQRWSTWQPVVFGVGQVVFALGFGYAGMERKVYGTEQVVRTTGEIAGLSVMGAGGVVALAGGVMFLVVILASRRQAAR